MFSLLRFNLRLAVVCPAVAMASSGVCGEEFLLLPGSSFLRGELQADVPIQGAFVGDFDPRSNPFGTETRPPDFERGNTPISMFGSIVLAGSFDGLHPSGMIDASWDLTSASMEIHAFDFDLGVRAGQPVLISQSVEGNSSPFVTVQPDGQFPDGLSEPITLDAASIISMKFYSDESIPADLLFVAEDIWAVFANIEGTLEIRVETEGGIVIRTASASYFTNGALFLDQGPRLELGFFSSFGEGADSESFPVSNLSMSIATSEGRGQAGVVFAGTGRAPEFDLFLDLGIASVAGRLPDPDLNGDGRVDAIDLGLILLQWEQEGPNAADLDRNGRVGSGDLARLLVEWSSDRND